MTDTCPGGSKYVEFDAERLGPNHAACPVCGRRTSFHRITGRFARHVRAERDGALMAAVENGTRVVMGKLHPHKGKAGFVRMQPGEEGGVDGMYLIEFDGVYEGNAYADPNDIIVVKERRAGVKP